MTERIERVDIPPLRVLEELEVVKAALDVGDPITARARLVPLVQRLQTAKYVQDAVLDQVTNTKEEPHDPPRPRA